MARHGWRGHAQRKDARRRRRSRRVAAVLPGGRRGGRPACQHCSTCRRRGACRRSAQRPGVSRSSRVRRLGNPERRANRDLRHNDARRTCRAGSTAATARRPRYLGLRPYPAPPAKAVLPFTPPTLPSPTVRAAPRPPGAASRTGGAIAPAPRDADRRTAPRFRGRSRRGTARRRCRPC